MPIESTSIPETDLRQEVIQKTMELSRQYGPEVLTAILGFASIYLISTGSSEYGNMATANDEKEKRAIAVQASEKIAVGTLGMATTTFIAGNPLFALPEIIAMIGSLKAYLDNKYPNVAAVSDKAHLGGITKAVAALTGTYAISMYVETAMQALPPLGLTALSIAFSGGLRQEIYRVLTLTGGASLIVGSAASAAEALGNQNTVGAIMSATFVALNALFTVSEWKEIKKMGGLKSVIAGACLAVVEKIREVLPKKHKE